MPGLVDGRLAPPPRSPNCVSSQADPSDRVHHVAPLTLAGGAPEAQARLKRLVAAMPRTRLVTEDEGYLHFTFTTALFRWVDDVEFLLDEEAGKIHVRSASRVGRGDLGTNRRRVEAVRRAWEP